MVLPLPLSFHSGHNLNVAQPDRKITPSWSSLLLAKLDCGSFLEDQVRLQRAALCGCAGHLLLKGTQLGKVVLSPFPQAVSLREVLPRPGGGTFSSFA